MLTFGMVWSCTMLTCSTVLLCTMLTCSTVKTKPNTHAALLDTDRVGPRVLRSKVYDSLQQLSIMSKPKYAVHKNDLKRGAKMEAKEHPWASPTRARRIARDHLSTYGPGAYRAEPVTEKIVQNINKKMGARPIRRKPRSAPSPFSMFAGYLR